MVNKSENIKKEPTQISRASISKKPIHPKTVTTSTRISLTKPTTTDKPNKQAKKASPVKKKGPPEPVAPPEPVPVPVKVKDPHTRMVDFINESLQLEPFSVPKQELPAVLLKVDGKDEQEKLLCNCFGEIEFEQDRRAKYLRVNNATYDQPDSFDYFEAIYKLLIEMWGAFEPDIIIRIVGSRQLEGGNLKKTSQKLGEAIVKAASSADKRCWVVTSGTNKGLTKTVGLASAEKVNRDFLCLGLVPWEALTFKDRKKLCCSKKHDIFGLPSEPEPAKKPPVIATLIKEPVVEPPIVDPLVDPTTAGTVTALEKLENEILAPSLEPALAPVPEPKKSPEEIREERRGPVVVAAVKGAGDDSDQYLPHYKGKWPQKYATTQQDPNSLARGHDFFFLVNPTKPIDGDRPIVGNHDPFEPEAEFGPSFMKAIDEICRQRQPDRQPILNVVLLAGGFKKSVLDEVSTIVDLTSPATAEDERTKKLWIVVAKGLNGVGDLLAHAFESRWTPQYQNGANQVHLPNFAHPVVEANCLNFLEIFGKHFGLENKIDFDEQTAKQIWNITTAAKDSMTVCDISKIGQGSVPLEDRIVESIFSSKVFKESKTLDKFIMSQTFDRFQLLKELMATGGQRPDLEQMKLHVLTAAMSTGQHDLLRFLIVERQNWFGFSKWEAANQVGAINSSSSEIEPVMPEYKENKAGDFMAQLYFNIWKLFKNPDVRQLFNSLLPCDFLNRWLAIKQGNRVTEDHILRCAAQIGSTMLSYCSLMPACCGNCCRCKCSNSNSKRPVDDIKIGLRGLFFQQLFLGHDEIALILWRQVSNEHLATALVASSFLDAISKRAKANGLLKLAEQYANLSMSWESRASKMLDECFAKVTSEEPDERNIMETMTMEVVRSLSGLWQDETCLDIAYETRRQFFMEHFVVNKFLSKIWHGKISPGLCTWKIYGAAFTMGPIFAIPHEDGPVGCAVNKVAPSESGNNRSVPGRLCDIYSTPVVKFAIRSVTSLIYSLFFVFFILLDRRDEDLHDVVEVVLWIWTGLNMLDLGETFYREKEMPIRRKFKFFLDKWQIIEIIGFIIMIIGAILRAAPDLIYSHTCYSLACLCFWAKMLHFFHGNEYLGTNLILIMKMLKNVWFFGLLYLVILVAFATSQFAIMHPGNRIDDFRAYLHLVVVNATYRRWWNLVGFNLDASLQETEGTCEATATLASTAFSTQNHTGTDNVTQLEPLSSSCSQTNFVSVMLYMTFVVLTNIFLLSLLIANFTKMADEKPAALAEWRFTRYRMCRLYYNTSACPPPLNLVKLCVYLGMLIVASIANIASATGSNNRKKSGKKEVTDLEEGKIGEITVAPTKENKTAEHDDDSLARRSTQSSDCSSTCSKFKMFLTNGQEEKCNAVESNVAEKLFNQWLVGVEPKCESAKNGKLPK